MSLNYKVLRFSVSKMSPTRTNIADLSQISQIPTNLYILGIAMVIWTHSFEMINNCIKPQYIPFLTCPR